LTARM